MPPVNVVYAGTALLLALSAFAACAAERGIYTVVDGDVRVLRKTTWYRLQPGARAEDGDVVDVGERQQLQIEITRGPTLALIGPSLAYVAESPPAKPGAPIAVTLQHGWAKAADTPKSPPLTLDL